MAGELSFEIDLTALKEELGALQDIRESIKKIEAEGKDEELPKLLAQYAKNLEGVVSTVQKALEFSVMRKEESFKRHKVLEEIRDGLKNIKPEKAQAVDFTKLETAIGKLSFDKFLRELKKLLENRSVSVDNFNDMPLAQGGATATNQAAILTKLQALIDGQGQVDLTVDQINLNTDTLEANTLKSAETMLDYKLSDEDWGTTANTVYRGYIDKAGNYFICKETISGTTKTVRYCKGSSGYSTATTGGWATRATRSDYDYFDVIF